MITEESVKIIYDELDWLSLVIDQSIRTYLLQEGHERSWLDIPLPDIEESEAPYARWVKEWGVDVYGRLAVSLALAPHVRPELLDIFFGKNAIYDRCFTEFGGVTHKNHSGFVPTAQTLCFIITLNAPEKREILNSLLHKKSRLIVEDVLMVSESEQNLPKLGGILSVSERWIHYFFSGQMTGVEHSDYFPATAITTNLDWEDVVLEDAVMEQVQEIITWLNHGEKLLLDWGLNKKIKPGFRTLFYGPPGTGKTLTATLLGKISNREVYKVDLSMIVSKYIGETEKNLSRIFDVAENRNWILFFDEADALFGKRTAANSSNDRHANQQTAYLLQRIEDFPGVVILASNLRANMDDAFTRRFQSVIHFDMPGVEERVRLWQNAFSGACRLDSEINFVELAEEYEIAGGSIINVLRHCALAAVRRDDPVITKEDIIKALRKEFKKENKFITS